MNLRLAIDMNLIRMTISDKPNGRKQRYVRCRKNSLVQKKKAKGMSIQEVAEWLEEEETTIAELWDVKETSKDNHAS